MAHSGVFGLVSAASRVVIPIVKVDMILYRSVLVEHSVGASRFFVRVRVIGDQHAG